MTATAKITRLVKVSEDWLTRSIERGAVEPFAEIVDITPELAVELLKRNEDNRQIYKTLVEVLAAEIRAGLWRMNGESIVVAATGELNDGQHRLRAIAEAGATCRSAIVFGATRESRITLDTGRRRYAADHLHFEGVPNPSLAAALVRAVLAYERAGGAHFRDSKYVTIPEQVERVRTDDGIREAAGWGGYAYPYCRSLISGSQIGTVLYLLSQIDPLDAGTYLDGVAFGEGLKRSDPAYAVRRELSRLDGRQRDARIAIVLRGWICFRQGTEAGPASLSPAIPLPPPGILKAKRPAA